MNGPTPLFQATAAATARKTEVTVLPEADNARYLGTYVDALGTPPLGTSCKVSVSRFSIANTGCDEI